MDYKEHVLKGLKQANELKSFLGLMFDTTEDDAEHLAKTYHEICREMVNKQIGMITKPTQPYLEWDQLSEAQKDGRRFIAKQLLDQYFMVKR